MQKQSPQIIDKENKMFEKKEQTVSEQKISEKIINKQPQQQEQCTYLLNLKQTIKQLTTEINSQLAESQNEIHINAQIKKLILLEINFHNVKDLYVEKKQEQVSENKQKVEEQSKDNKDSIDKTVLKDDIQQKIKQIQKQTELYEPTMQEIQERKQAFQQQMNDDGWTDATQSQTGDFDPNDIMVFDDQMLQQMGMGTGQEEGSQQDKIDFDQLQDQFVKGGQSDCHHLYGQHKDKFCVSVRSIISKGLIISGGGDDQMHIYKLQKEVEKQQQKQQQIKKNEENGDNMVEVTKKEIKCQILKKIAHTETVTNIELSFDKEHIFSLTEKELIHTDASTLESQKVPIEPPTNISCHSQGGVFATSDGYNVQIYNIKGLKFYDSYCLDQQVTLLKWTPNGKQLVTACDNKLRIVTPKTRQITKAAGTIFHQGEITALHMTATTVFTGCLDGYIYATNLTNGKILGGTEQFNGTINNILVADNYLIIGPSENRVYWYDQNKLKKLFEYQLKGASTDIIQISDFDKNLYAIADIKGHIYIFDKRNPINEKIILHAGNSIHQLYNEGSLILAACEDGCVRSWDLKQVKFN